MDTRNKSGYDGNRAGPPGVDPGPDLAEPLETRLNPGHALCPPNLNWTAVEQVRA